MDAREALARGLCVEQEWDPDSLAGRLDVDGRYPAWHLFRAKADAVLSALPSGYSIIHDSENHGPTVERAVEAIQKANERVPGVGADCMGTDNLAIVLCSAFDDGDQETEDDTGWSEAARNGYEQTISAIRDHYTAAIRAMTTGGRGETS